MGCMGLLIVVCTFARVFSSSAWVPSRPHIIIGKGAASLLSVSCGHRRAEIAANRGPGSRLMGFRRGRGVDGMCLRRLGVEVEGFVGGRVVWWEEVSLTELRREIGGLVTRC